MKKYIFFIILIFYSLSAFSKDEKNQYIYISWRSSNAQKSIYLCASENQSFKIDWGDGTEDDYIGKGDSVINCVHQYSQKKEYQITIKGKQNRCHFTFLDIQNQQINQLDITSSHSLLELNCSNNNLSQIDISNNHLLNILDCSNNAFSLSALYSFSVDLKKTKLGKQIISKDTVAIDSVLKKPFPSKIKNKNTTFQIRKGNTNAIKNTDYVLTDETIIFKTRGTYTVEITNDAILAQNDSPVSVVYTFIIVQQIKFTWTSSKEIRSFEIGVTQGKDFIINWGDGNYDVYKGKGKSVILCEHQYLHEDAYDVTINTNEGDFLLWKSNNNQLKSIHFNGCTNLKEISCFGNDLRILDVNSCKALNQISCYNNSLSLSNLLVISNQIKDQNRKLLGVQYLAVDTVTIDYEIDFSDFNSFNQVATTFIIYKDDSLAIEGFDYIFKNNKLVFKNQGVFVVGITNDMITSKANFPAEVIATYVVSQQIFLTWFSEGNEKQFSVGTTDNAHVTVDWGDGKHSIYELEESKPFFCTHTYAEEKEYNVLISSTEADVYYFSCPQDQITKLNLKGCPSLSELDCSYNRITTLDISNCKQLTKIMCNNNALLLSELYPLSMHLGIAAEKELGNQLIPALYLTMGTEINLCDEAEFNEISTTFIIYRENHFAKEFDDYEFNKHSLILKNEGIFKVEMINPEIFSSNNDTTKVVTTYIAGALDGNEYYSNTFRIYPNPTRDIIWIEVPTENDDNPDVRVFSQTGELLLHTKAHSVDLSSFIDGTYLVQVNGKTVKIMKQQ